MTSLALLLCLRIMNEHDLDHKRYDIQPARGLFSSCAEES
jgi:hypothetical protein